MGKTFHFQLRYGHVNCGTELVPEQGVMESEGGDSEKEGFLLW